ncbi:hypothetical protein C1645_736170 [Glomus cerebriforme]|uniref:Uncharacterized protein n=1 Tax=Glomus cerebriforme TaxID=658196 RepID=A0A397T8Q9_9GLOM|nr:hypothetical protein C1645_736170 [Glomus cerebriforme]
MGRKNDSLSSLVWNRKGKWFSVLSVQCRIRNIFLAFRLVREIGNSSWISFQKCLTECFFFFCRFSSENLGLETFGSRNSELEMFVLGLEKLKHSAPKIQN